MVSSRVADSSVKMISSKGMEFWAKFIPCSSNEHFSNESCLSDKLTTKRSEPNLGSHFIWNLQSFKFSFLSLSDFLYLTHSFMVILVIPSISSQSTLEMLCWSRSRWVPWIRSRSEASPVDFTHKYNLLNCRWVSCNRVA